MSNRSVTSNETTHFKIVIQAYRAEKWIIDCLKSVSNQKYNNWQAIIHVEPCSDNTFRLIQNYLRRIKDSRFVLRKNAVRRRRPLNDMDAIRIADPKNDDVIMFLDGDDHLHGPHVFSILNTVYQDENVWVTWGSYMHSHDGSKGMASGPILPPDEDPMNGRRNWIYSHLKTFRYFLYKGIRDEDLKDEDGEYYSVAWDMALMFPIVEMAGPEHGRFISQVMYVYNTDNPISNEKIAYGKCLKFSHEIRNLRTPYCKRMKEELCKLKSRA